MAKKETIAMLLAGGQGSRLYALTNKIAKPAVPFGSKYRIIDFVLSNCINSNIDTVGVLTQYQPLVLNEYIGNGQPWDLDREFGGVHVLPPYQAKERSDWYKNTANAIYQNLHFINLYDPEYVLILSGDHIYKMEYDKMVKEHKKTGADCTIAVIPVPIEEASRFGIMSKDAENRITEFEEKPKQPKSNLASMGIYIFSKKVLEDYLIADDADDTSAHDFGKNIIPKMLKDNKKMMAYTFDHYWKDVGTLSSLWEANMELLGNNPKFDLYDPQWVIHSRNPIEPPQYIGNDAKLVNSMVGGGCEIEGKILSSVVSSGVKLGKNSIVKDSIVFSNVEIGDNCVIEYSIIDENVSIANNCKVGGKRGEVELAVIGRDVKIENGTIIDGGKMVE
ncbi:MAG: glucose-1-phosphate adenylyltransferase [Clostridia bacterium]